MPEMGDNEDKWAVHCSDDEGSSDKVSLSLLIHKVNLTA